MFTVTFHGFRTLQQAETFASWYSGSGEQNASYWMECHANVTSCNTSNIEIDEANEANVKVTLDVQEGPSEDLS